MFFFILYAFLYCSNIPSVIFEGWRPMALRPNSKISKHRNKVGRMTTKAVLRRLFKGDDTAEPH